MLAGVRIAMEIDHEILFRSLSAPAFEHVRVTTDHPGWMVFDSMLVREQGETVLRGGYTLIVDYDWRTLELRVMCESEPGAMQALHLLADGDGHWTDAQERPIPSLDGVIDVDIAWSPLTNTLPIRRLDLGEGAEVLVPVAYIAMPSLALSRKDQTYQRRGENQVRFTAEGGTFSADLRVDGNGVIRMYPDLFERI